MGVENVGTGNNLDSQILEEKNSVLLTNFVMASYIYHEKQESALCGQHALNMLVQGPVFNEISLSEVGLELDQLERSLSREGAPLMSENVGLFGNFSIQVLRMALEKIYDIRLVSSEAEDERRVDPLQEQGFIGTNHHVIDSFPLKKDAQLLISPQSTAPIIGSVSVKFTRNGGI